MKRYTGQQALYEAISRSQAKAKRGGILEKLRGQPPKPEPAAPEESSPRIGPVPTAREVAPPVVKGPARPTAKERLRQALANKETPAAKPVGKSVPPVAKPLPVEGIGRPAPHRPAQQLLRPRAVQFNAGRIELSVPYHIGVAAALVLILVGLVAFRIGQEYPAGQVQVAGPANPPGRSAPQNAATVTAKKPLPETPAVAPRVTEPVAGQRPAQAQSAPQEQGDHLIVLARSKRQEDLDPVIKYFGDNGVELMALPLTDATRKSFTENGYKAAALGSGDGFLLIASRRYNNPEKEGTDGYGMKLKIIDLGTKYKAQPGSQMFAPHYFGDAYGIKIK